MIGSHPSKIPTHWGHLNHAVALCRNFGFKMVDPTLGTELCSFCNPGRGVIKDAHVIIKTSSIRHPVNTSTFSSASPTAMFFPYPQAGPHDFHACEEHLEVFLFEFLLNNVKYPPKALWRDFVE